MKLFLKRCVPSLLCVWITMMLPAFSQENPIRYIGIESGMSNNSVTCALQDQYGFIWLGTYDGLNRYDGYEFKSFHNRWNDPKSLSNNHIQAIVDTKNRIYVGTEKGLMYLDLIDLKFHPLYFKDDQQKSVKIDFNINHLVKDNHGRVYASSGKQGLLCFSGQDTTAKEILAEGLPRHYQTHVMVNDNLGRVWVFMNGNGLGYIDNQTGKIRIVDRTLLSGNSLAVDKKNRVWVGTNNGVYIYDNGARQLKRFDDNEHHLLATNISSLTCTRAGEMWIANNGAGINIWHLNDKLSYLVPGETNRNLSSGSVFATLEDREGRMWIATLRGGVNIIDRYGNPFTNYLHQQANPNSVANNFIRSFGEDAVHNIWIGTDGGGLTCWNRSTNHYTTYAHKGPGSLSSNMVVSIVKDFKNVLWIATFNGGVDAFDSRTQTFKHYVCLKPNAAVEEKNFWKLFEDSQHRLWASSTWGGTLYLYNRTTDRFDIVDPGLSDVHAFFVAKDGAIWGGNYTQLIQIDTKNKQHHYYAIGQPVRAIAQDDLGRLWVGTDGGGLLLFDAASGKFTRYTTDDGLPNNSVLNILVDQQNRLWCSTFHGLACFNTATKKFTNYYASDGLQSNQFQYGAALKLSSGEMLFGGIKGFTMFDPLRVRSYVHVPQMQLTDFMIDNVAVGDNAEYSQGHTLNAIRQIEIPFSKASLAIGYTALEYSFPEKISYAYYLEGWDHGWNYVGKQKTAYYSRLNEGTYILNIKSTNTAGVWGESLKIKLVVLPPWYRTWWAYLLYTILIGGTIYSLWLFRIRQTRLQYELQIGQIRMEKEKEANERKLSFFTNVSHEFRTPLTLIINPIKDLLKLSKGNNEELNIVYRNASRLLGLVDQLLMFRKSESEVADLKISVQNLTTLCREIFNCFTHQAKIKSIDYTFESAAADIPIYVDKEKIEIAIFNLITNALKFTPEHGHIHIRLREDERSAFFEIEDTGIGISVDVGEKLFDKFYQVRDASSLKTGFGIGLYLVKNFIELHKGTISYQSTSGEGTTFTLCLPKGRSHLLEYPLVEQPPVINAYVEELIDAEVKEEGPITPASADLELMISDQQSILVIDDNAELRDYVRSILEHDYKVYEADDGQSGLEMIKKILPDVVISDIVMPNLTGLDLCRIVKSDSQLSHIPIVLLTGESGAEIKLQGIEEGAVDFINKPFDKDLLIARVKGIIKSKRELQNYFFNEVTLKNDSRHLSEENKQFLYKCIGIIEDSLLDPVLEVNAIADKMGMSYSNLYKRIKNITGQTINGFIRFVRLRKAAELLIETNCNVNEAAFRVGFSDVKYFREHFYKQFGLNPSEFIKRHRVAFQNGAKQTQKI